MGRIGFISAVLAVAAFSVAYTEHVPVYLWTNSRTVEHTPAIPNLNERQFTKDLPKDGSLVIVFAEETLSPEDFMFRDANGRLIFTETSSLTTPAYINYWPLVKNPIAGVTQLFGDNFIKTSGKLAENVDLRKDQLLIVDLNDAEDGEDRLEMLKRHDKIIADVYASYAKNNKVIALLTSHRASWILSDSSPANIRERRQTKNENNGTTENTSKTYRNKDLLMYTNSAGTLHFKDQTVQLTDFTLEDENKIDENTMNSTLVSSTIPNIQLKFAFQFIPGYWMLNSIVAINTSGDSHNLMVKDVYAPQGFSYHCHAQLFYNVSHPDVYLNLTGFQVQVFLNSTNTSTQKFGDAYDCVGFTSAPIWSGLFVTFIMVLIMTFGLSMMMDIKTMDRFDDPKGKTITINASE